MVATRFYVAHTRQSSETHFTTARHDQPQNFPDHASSGPGTHHGIQSIPHRRAPACPPTSQTTSSNFPQRRVGAPTIPTESFQFSNVRMRSSVRVCSRPVSCPATEQLALTTIGAAIHWTRPKSSDGQINRAQPCCVLKGQRFGVKSGWCCEGGQGC
jgi:hypothetical protein